MSSVLDILTNQVELFTVLKWWALWQFFDFVLGKLKITLRKPWQISSNSALQSKE
jgi:hypothetical protein